MDVLQLISSPYFSVTLIVIAIVCLTIAAFSATSKKKQKVEDVHIHLHIHYEDSPDAENHRDHSEPKFAAGCHEDNIRTGRLI